MSESKGMPPSGRNLAEMSKNLGVTASTIISNLVDNTGSQSKLDQIPAATNVSSPANATRKPIFRASRICRTDVKVNCADFVNDSLLIGTDGGLFGFEMVGSESKMNILSTRRYNQIDVIEELGILVSRSGKHGIVSVHDISAPNQGGIGVAGGLSSAFLKKPGKFENETKIKKIKETKDCKFYSVSAYNASVYLSIAMPNSILIMKWAPQPFNKFMKMKELAFDTSLVQSMKVVEFSQDVLKLYVKVGEKFRVVDIQTLTSEDVNVASFGTNQKFGEPVRALAFDEKLLLGYSRKFYSFYSHLLLYCALTYALSFSINRNGSYINADIRHQQGHSVLDMAQPNDFCW